MLAVVLWIAGAIAALITLYILYMVIRTIYTHATGVAPRGVWVAISAPATARVREVFSIVVTVTDTSGADRVISSIDFDAGYLKHIAIESIDPAPREKPSNAPTLGVHVHSFDLKVPANASTSVTFRCHPMQPGDAAGDITVYVDKVSFRYISKPARTIVSV
ncbi:MAG: hypothetical protein U0637_04890 [Phycisphaerales bacterium]